MNSHLDEVKLSINETMESVANRFVEITKTYKSFVIDDFLAPSHANSDFSLTEEDVRKNREMYGYPDGRKKCQLELVFRAGLSKEGTISGFSPFIRWLLVAHCLY
jgi:hypothetical protein